MKVGFLYFVLLELVAFVKVFTQEFVVGKRYFQSIICLQNNCWCLNSTLQGFFFSPAGF